MTHKCYCIGAAFSETWNSSNRESGIYECDCARTLDSMFCGYPNCNQGGIAVVEMMGTEEPEYQGMIADHPTPKATTGGTSFTISARDYKGGMVVVVSEGDGTADGE